jgi:photosystem II stability/assembly factor-like uncharacterized protein
VFIVVSSLLGPSWVSGEQECEWQVVESPTDKDLYSVFMLSENEGWAVGGYLLGGVILYWNGEEWKVVKNVESELYDIFMLSSNDGWAVGDGIVLHWDGTAWSEVNPTSGSWGKVYSIYMLSPEEGWAVGDTGRVWHWDGSTWSLTTISSGMAEQGFMLYPDLKSVFMLSSNEGWAVGSEDTSVGGGYYEPRGIIFRWDGDKWYKVAKFSNIQSIDSIYMLSSNEGWACGTLIDGSTGVILVWNGDNWNVVENSISGPLRSIHMLFSSEGWAVGGKIWRWNGNEWSEVEKPSLTYAYRLNSVYMLSPIEGWVVGSNGTILKYDTAKSDLGGATTQNQLWLWLVPILGICVVLGILLLRRRSKTEQVW